MKISNFAFRLLSLAMTLVLIFGVSGLSALAADESDYVAEFRIETDKSAVKKDEDVTVSVFLKNNYYICTMSLIAVYDCKKFTIQNTSDTNSKGFLTFEGSMADAYRTDGSWKSPEGFYTERNSNTAYWSRKDVMSRYKFVYASWVADTSISWELIQLSEEEKIVSFVLKANEDIDDVSDLVFMSLDFQKTNESKQGLLFVGRSKTEEFSATDMVTVGQTIIYNGEDPTKAEVSVSISPADGTNTVIDKENGFIYGLDEAINSLDSYVKVEGYTLEYTYFNGYFGTGTKVECLLNGEVKETYYIVIFGDLTGDSVIDIYDVSAFSAVVNGDIEADGAFSVAADIFADEVVDIYDYMVAASVVNGDIEISQIKQ